MATMGSLFDGIGGFPLAFSRAGVATRWVVELDAACRRVSAKHFPEAEAFGDVRDCGAHNLAPVGIITAGFPCQDVSVAGARAGLAGARSGLFFEIVRIVREMREATDGACPKYLVLENVPGLLSSHGGRDFAVVLGELAGLGAVDIGWRVLDAQYFGVAQRRRRVFIVVCFGAERSAEILFEREGGGGHPPARGAAGKGLTHGTALGSHARSGGNASNSSHARGGPVGMGIVEEATPALRAGRTQTVAAAGVPERAASLGASVARGRGGGGLRADLDSMTYVPELAYCLAAGAGGSKFGNGRQGQDTYIPEVTHALTAEGHDASEDGTGRGTSLVPVVSGPLGGRSGEGGFRQDLDNHGAYIPVAFTQNQRDEVRDLGGLSGALAAQPGMKQQTYVAVAFTERTRADGRNVEAQEELAYALLNPGQGGRTQENRVVTPTMAVRRLTPLECERLMGLPDGWTEGHVDSARYRMLGNSVAVPVVEWLARRLVAASE